MFHWFLRHIDSILESVRDLFILTVAFGAISHGVTGAAVQLIHTVWLAVGTSLLLIVLRLTVTDAILRAKKHELAHGLGIMFPARNRLD